MPAKVAVKQVRLPPGCGEGLKAPLLYNPYQQKFMQDRRLRHCLNCNTTGSMDENCRFTCAKCKKRHTSNITAPRVFDRFCLLAGRGSGKTLIGAHAVREEALIPNSIIWAMGPTYKILHDSTFPTLVGLIPPEWVKRWDPEHTEITLQNNTLIAFRSVDDPERARGPHGVTCGWFDEAAQSPLRAYKVFEPTLIKAGGIVIATTTPLGFDWTYEEFEQRAKIYHEKGYWFISFHSEENPLFRTSPVMVRQIDRARKTMDPDTFAEEYQAERRNATGLVYKYTQIEKQILKNDAAVQAKIPEWPNISPERALTIGLDSGVDHPFGAVKIVATENGLVVVADYLQRLQALSLQLPAICTQFGLSLGMHEIRWAANKNEANLRLEFGLKGVGVNAAEADHRIGIQRVQSWLHTEKLWFAYTAQRTIDQLRAYRYAQNTAPDGQKRPIERVFKLNDELPDALRYALMSWPQIPEPTAPVVGRDMRHLDEQTRSEIERMATWHKKGEEHDLTPMDEGYPTGDLYTTSNEAYDVVGGMWD